MKINRVVTRAFLVSVVLILSAGCSHDIKLRVIDADTGQPVPKATVYRWEKPYDLVLSPLLNGWRQRETGADGRMDVPVRGDGTKYDFHVDAWDYEDMDGFGRIEPPGTLVIDWSYRPHRIHDDKAGPERIEVGERTLSTSRPDADGVFDVRLPKKRHVTR
jgi:hypothetical protein